MALQSQLFRGDPKLEAAAVSDPAHIVPGAMGEHVRKIQQALIQLEGAAIDPDGVYGPATAAAVLAYKQKRNIVNRSYQTQADNIVGKMTIAALDKEMLKKEGEANPPICLFRLGGLAPVSVSARLDLVAAPTPPSPSELTVMNKAFQESRRTLQDTLKALTDLQKAVLAAIAKQTSPSLTQDQQKVLVAVVRWLLVAPTDLPGVSAAITSANALIVRNLNIRTSAGAVPPLLRNIGATFHAQADGWINTDLGVSCGDQFFRDGPNCQRDVLTHEWFHLVSVNHGAGRNAKGEVVSVPRASVTTTQNALDSADHLAQLVSEVTTGTFDSCPNK
jgi:peptidoglycan hydrolase-like protein with peptidoglycan-binding domain